MIYKIFISLLGCASIFLGIQNYFHKSEIKELKQTVQSQLADLEIKKLEISSLETAIETQNKQIVQYQKDTSNFTQQIDSLNKQIEEALQTPYSREQMCNSNSTDKEALEWICIKRNSVLF